MNASASTHATPAHGAAPRQAAVYANYLALHRRLSEWAHTDAPRSAPLAVACGLDLAGAEAAIATVLAGASFLGIDARPALQKSAQRNRACDFLVHALDEALRMLKLALRKSQPIAVGLLAEPDAALAQLAARGVQPQFLFIASNSDESKHATSAEMQASLDLLIQRGAQPILPLDPPVLPASEMLAHWTAATPSDLHRIDTLALDHLAQAESARRHWLQHAPAYFLRQSPPERICSLTAEEIAQMQTALQAQPFRSALLGPVCFTWSDPSSQTHTLHIAPSGSSA